MKPNKLTPGFNVLWESSRMMLPEHVEALHQFAINNQRQQRPELDDQELDEIGRKLADAQRTGATAIITTFDEFENMEVNGRVVSVDPITRRIKVIGEDGDVTYIAFEDVLGVDFV